MLEKNKIELTKIGQQLINFQDSNLIVNGKETVMLNPEFLKMMGEKIFDIVNSEINKK